MLYELRTYQLKPGMTGEFEKRWAPMLEKRQALSPLGALFRTEIGPLNAMVHIWPYESLDERGRVRQQAVQDGVWPPATSDLTETQQSEILTPAPFMRPLQPAALGGIYELRIYTYRPGTIAEVVKRWGERIAEREQVSPLAGAWYTEIGGLNRWFHLWPYADLAERDRLRAEAFKSPNWPPPTREFLVKQENMILVPSSLSPLR